MILFEYQCFKCGISSVEDSNDFIVIYAIK